MEKNILIPKYLYLEITSECNLKCKHCLMWLNKDKEELNLDEQLSIIDQFYQLNNNGIVYFTGGETFLKKDNLYSLSNRCRDLGLTNVVLTNGSYFHKMNYEEVLLSGINAFVISLDGHTAEIHDYIRGIDGTFKELCQKLNDIIKLRNKQFKNIKFIINCVLFEKNIYSLVDYLSFCEELGVDGVHFQPLMKGLFDIIPQGNSKFFTNNIFQNRDKAMEAIDELHKLSKTNSLIMNTESDFYWMKKYIETNGDFKSYEQFCYSHYKNIIIDHSGNYTLCMNMQSIENISNFEYNFRNINLSNFWYSDEINNTRKLMDDCRNSCGILNCHRK